MSQTYPLPLPTQQLLINGVDRSGEVLAHTLDARFSLGAQVSTLAFSMKPPESWRGTALAAPTVGQPVLLQQQQGSGPMAPVFGGSIQSCNAVRIAYKTARWDVQCVDWTHQLTRTLVNAIYVGQAASDIILDIVRTHAGGILTTGVTATPDVVIQSIAFAQVYPLDAIQQIVSGIGFRWFVGADRVLYVYDPLAVPRTSPQTITDTSGNFMDLAIEPQLDQVRNRIYVQGGEAQSDPIVETFDFDGVIGTAPIKLAHMNIYGNIGVTVSGMRGDFFTIDGIAQLTAQQGIVDESTIPGGWLVDAANGEVARAVNTPIPADGSFGVFRYSWKVPINIERESQASIAATALLEGTDWVTTVSGDGPLHWWALNERSGTLAVNRAQGRTAYSGMYQGGFQFGTPGAIANSTDGAVAFDGMSGRVVMVSGVQWPSGSYTVEAWVRMADQVNVGIVSQILTSGVVLGYSALGGAGYYLQHTGVAGIDTFGSDVPATVGSYDHVVGMYVAGSGSLWVNNQRAVAPTAMASALITGRLEIADFKQVAAHCVGAQIDEVVLYDHGLSDQQIGEHYFAGRWGGVREYALTDNTLVSFDQARNAGDGQLASYADVITQLTWNSYVAGWQVGDSVTVNVTQGGLGRAYAGSALIQQVEIRWTAPQRPQYLVTALETRYHWLDHERQLVGQRQLAFGNVPNQPLFFVENYEATIIGIDGSVSATLDTLPYRVAPDWGSGTTPYITPDFWEVDPTRY